MVQTVHVSTAAQLKQAIASASTDTKFVLKGGNYGTLNLYAQQQPHLTKIAMTFVSEDINKPATLTGLNAVGIDNLTFDGLTFDYSAAKGAHQTTKWARIETANNVTVKNSTFDGDNANGLSKFDDGYGTGTGLFLRYIDGLTVENNTVYSFFDGITVKNSDNVLVKNNEAYDLASDGLNFASVIQTVIEGNYVHDFRVHPNSYTHNDMIQFWTQNEKTPTTDVVIRGNILDAGSGPGSQSIWINNEAITKQGAGSNMLYRNFLIEDNVIRNAHKHGIAVNNIDGLKIQNNTIVRSDGSAIDSSPQYTPVININGGTKNVQINDNVIHGVNGKNWTGSGNLYVQREWTTEPNHFNDLFVNGLSDNLGIWDDLMALPGGAIEKAGIGSSLLRYDTTPSQTTALLLSDDGDQLARHHHSFDVSNVYGPSGKIATKNAQVVWDFGDGKTGSGLSPTHVYTKPGIYEVTATVKLAGGKTITADKVIEAETPVLIQTDFTNGGKDLSGFQNAKSVKGVSFVNDGGSTVGKFGKTSYIRYDRAEELLNNEGITILADFRKDNGTDTGRLINFSDAIIVKIQGNALQVTVTTDQGSKMFNQSGAGINDTAWHRLAITWDEKTDKAIVYIDGKQIGNPITIKGTMISGNAAQDFSIGSNFGDAFNGLVDNVSFLGGAMDAGEVSSLHSGHKTLDAILNTSSGGTGSQVPTVPNTGTTSGSTQNTDTSSNTNTSTDTGTDTGGSTPQAPSSSTATVDTGTKSGSIWRYEMDDQGDAVKINANVATKDLDVLLQWDRVKIDSDNDGKYEHIIHLEGGGFDNGSFVASKVTGGTLVTFQPDTPVAPSSSTATTSGGSSGSSSSGSGTQTPQNTSKVHTDLGTWVNGVRRYDIDTNDIAKVRTQITEADLDIQLKWDRIKIDSDNDGKYEHIIHLEGGGFDNGTFKTTAAGSQTLVTFEPAGGSGASTGSSGSSVVPSGEIITKGVKSGGVERFTLENKADAIFIDERVKTNDLDVRLKWDSIKIDADNDGDLDYSIKLEGNFTRGDFAATSYNGGTLISFQPDSFDFG